MNLKHLRQKLLDANKQYVQANKDVDAATDELAPKVEAAFKDAWSQRFPTTKFQGFFSMRAGCKGENYEADATLYRVGTSHACTDGTWETKSTNPPVAEVEEFLQKLSEDTGVPFHLYKIKRKTKEDIKGIQCKDDVRVYYGDSLSQVEKLEVNHMGWDISDPVFLLTFKDSQAITVLYANDGHGGYASNKVEPGDVKALELFVQFLAGTSLEGIRNTLRRKILKSWSIDVD